ncbi:Uma2 family endonuclease, partial [Acinetobacter baumannii]|uniref:Uma2 family endonuclease n=1 Tax=Acinetobacter baumannii TaxID=470 RepID=UPI003D6B82E3
EFRMASGTQTTATLDDLYRVEGKAELIAGRIVHFMASGRKPSRVALRIARSLDDYAEATGQGEAYGDNIGFAVSQLSSGRQSFSPDASYFR